MIEEEYALEYLSKLIHGINRDKYYALKHTKDRTAYLRAIAINSLIDEAVTIFLENEKAILNGTFDNSLLEKCKFEAQINDIISISIAKIYNSKEVIEKEVAGYRIIADLLHAFLTAVNNNFENISTNYDKLILQLLPKEYYSKNNTLYHRIIQVCGFVSIMSDSYAIKKHKKLTGNIL